MALYRSGGRKIKTAPFFQYEMEIAQFDKGSYAVIGCDTFGSRVFLGLSVSNDYPVEGLGTIHKHSILVGAPEEWLIKNKYEKI